MFIRRNDSLNFMIALFILHLGHECAFERMHVDDAANLVHIINFLMQELKIFGKNFLYAFFTVILAIIILLCVNSHFLVLAFDFLWLELSFKYYSLSNYLLVLLCLFHSRDHFFELARLLVKTIDVELTVYIMHD